jgi:protein O-mannosyl-transferase
MLKDRIRSKGHRSAALSHAKSEQQRLEVPRSAQSPRWPRRRRTLVVLALSALAALQIIVYQNSVKNGFVWDDNRQVAMNPDLRETAPWLRLFSSDVWASANRDRAAHTNYYRPLQLATYKAVAELFGLEPVNFHLLSIGVAVAVVFAAFAIYFLLTDSAALAFAAAALYAVHPIHTEAIDWISALPEIGCALFVFAAFALFLASCGRRQSFGASSEPNSTRPVLVLLSLISFAVALFWKETAVVLPIIIGVFILCSERTRFATRLRSAGKASAGYWLVLFAYLALRFRMLGFIATRQRLWQLTPLQFVLTDLHLLVLYLWKLINPIPLNAYHEFAPANSLGLQVWLDAAVVILGCAALVWALRRAPIAAFCSLWILITLLPVMDIYALGRNAFAERYLYLPSLGFCLLVVLLARAIINHLPAQFNNPVSAVLLIAAVGCCGAITLARNPDWRDDATLFRASLPLSPNAPFTHFMVAATAGTDAPSVAEAEEHYLRAIELAKSEQPPDLLDVSRSDQGLASLYSDLGDVDKALSVLRDWRAFDPGEPRIDAEEGLCLLKSGRWQQAEPMLNRALVAMPNDENVLNAFGILQREYKHNFNQAAELFRRALAIHTIRDDFRASLHNNLGGVYGDLEQFPSAIEQFQSAVAISPNDPEFHTNLALALAAVKRYDDAVAEADVALKIAPDYAPARALQQQLRRR